MGESVCRSVCVSLPSPRNAGVCVCECVLERVCVSVRVSLTRRGGGLGSRPKKMYGERLGDGVEYHLMKPTPRR